MSLVGLIPAAGRGVRAYPYTATIPKSMLEVDGVPLIERNVRLLRDQLGIREVRIVVGHQGDVIRRHFGDGSRLGVSITYLQNTRLDLELTYSIYLASRGVERPCCMVLADECYVGTDHRRLLDAEYGAALATCGVMTSEYAKQIRKNYTVAVEGGRIVDLAEKPARVSGPTMGVGTYLLRPELLRRLQERFEPDLEQGPRDWTGWLAELARSGAELRACRLTGRYVNVNSRDDLNWANYLVRDLHFDEKRTSFVYVIDDDEEAAARPVARFAEEAEVDEVVAVTRRAPPALQEVAARDKVRLVVAEPDTSIAGLVKLGLDSASGDILLLSYTDDTFAPRDVSKFLVYLRDADMVVGTRTTRQMIEQGTNMRGIVRWSHVVLAKLLQILWWRFESRFTDICCVYRGFWRSTYTTIRDNMTAPGIEVFPEMVIEVLRARRRVVEIPINYYNRDLEYDRVRGKHQTVGTFARIVGLLIRRRLADSPLGGSSRPARIAAPAPAVDERVRAS